MNRFLIFCVMVLLLSSLLCLVLGWTTLLKISTGSSISISSKVLSGRSLWHFITIIFSSFSVFSFPFLLLLKARWSDLQQEISPSFNTYCVSMAACLYLTLCLCYSPASTLRTGDWPGWGRGRRRLRRTEGGSSGGSGQSWGLVGPGEGRTGLRTGRRWRDRRRQNSWCGRHHHLHCTDWLPTSGYQASLADRAPSHLTSQGITQNNAVRPLSLISYLTLSSGIIPLKHFLFESYIIIIILHLKCYNYIA